MSEEKPRTARNWAAQILLRVERDEAYVAAALSAGLERSELAPRDRALVTELVYGVVRTEPFLLRRLERFGTLKASDEWTRVQLLLAAYQIEFLDRIPARAAIFEAVQAVREKRGARVGGFANAVLRRLSEATQAEPASLEEAIVSSTPSWLRKRLEKSVGPEEARALLVAEGKPKLGLRWLAGRAEPAWLQTDALRVTGVPGAFLYTGGGDPRRHPEHGQGDFVVQELGAQLIARSLGVQPGEQVLDVCAGRGQKTLVLAEVLGDSGQLVATDLHEQKLRALHEDAARLGAQVKTAVCDWSVGCPPEYQAQFDRVLVDAPCSGVGTLRRRPEILRRLQPEDPERLAALQTQILCHAAAALRNSGVLVFATCSVLRAEAEEVLQNVTDLFEPAPWPESSVNAFFSQSESERRLLPQREGTDGYFVACLRLKKSALS